MNKNSFKFTALSVATSMALALTGCGNDDNSHAFDSHHSVEATGQFIDAAVANVDVYQNGKKIDTTDAEGMFTYMTGSEVTFKLGALTLGSTEPKAIITPADLSSDTDTVVEILQVLQSLDEDNNLENGIFIPEATIEKLVTAFDPADDDASIIDAVKKDIPNIDLVQEQDAIEHFAQSQDTLKTSDSLSAVANNFVGYWQQSCDNGNQQVFELAKDSMNPNMLVQTGQYVNRKYENDDCTGTYDETLGYSSTNEPLTVKIMGTIYNEDGDLVVNAMRTEGSSNFFDSLVMASNDMYSGGGLTFSRKSSLAFDETPVNNKAEILAGYWQSECIESTNGSKKYYLNNVLQGDGTILIKQSLREDFTGSTCSGTGVVTVNEDSNGMIIPQSDIDGMVLNGNNQFVAEDHTVETYDRISEGDFPEVSEIPVDDVEQAVNTMVGYWRSDCLAYENTSVLAYVEVNKVNSTTIKIDPIINKIYNNTSCSGTPEAIYKKEADEADLSKRDLPNIVNNNRFIVEFEEDDEQRVESYNRIDESDFPVGDFPFDPYEHREVKDVVSGKVTFANGIIPDDVRIRITPAKFQNEGDYSSIECEVPGDGVFGSNCYASQAVVDEIQNVNSNTTYQVVVYLDENDDGYWNAGEKSFKWLGNDAEYLSWSNITID